MHITTIGGKMAKSYLLVLVGFLCACESPVYDCDLSLYPIQVYFDMVEVSSGCTVEMSDWKTIARENGGTILRDTPTFEGMDVVLECGVNGVICGDGDIVSMLDFGAETGTRVPGTISVPAPCLAGPAEVTLNITYIPGDAADERCPVHYYEGVGVIQ